MKGGRARVKAEDDRMKFHRKTECLNRIRRRICHRIIRSIVTVKQNRSPVYYFWSVGLFDGTMVD